MSKIEEVEYWVPEHVREYLRGLGFRLPLEPMEEYIRSWHGWMQSKGTFYDYRDSDGFGRLYEVHRRSIRPAMRVCREWGSLLLNDKTQVVCESQECTDWLQEYFTQTGFFPSAQATVVRAFGMGTGAWALWIDADRKDVRIRRYDARMVIPLSWDEEHVTECAFVTRRSTVGRPWTSFKCTCSGVETGWSLPQIHLLHLPFPNPYKRWDFPLPRLHMEASERRFRHLLRMETRARLHLRNLKLETVATLHRLPHLHLPMEMQKDFPNLRFLNREPTMAVPGRRQPTLSPRTRSSRCCSMKMGAKYNQRASARNTTRVALSPPSRSSSRR